MDKTNYLCYVNGSGQEIVLSSPDNTKWFELRGRTGFTAPEVELITQKYANGVTKVLKKHLQPRSVVISMMLTGESEEDRDRAFFEMISLLMDVNGGNTGRLYVKRSDGMTVYLNCAYSSGLSVNEQYRKFQQFDLEFFAPDAYFYKDLDDTVIDVNYGGYLTLSDTHLFGTHTMGEFESSGSGVITNNGAETLQPVIRLQNVNGTVKITNEDTGEVISMKNMSMTQGQTLVIDTRDDSKNIYIENADGTKQQAGQYLDWSNQDYEFPIISGDNHISYVGGDGSMIDKLTFSMSQRYLSA